MAKSSSLAQKAILDVVDNQIRDLNPPATKETFHRLVSEGVGQAEARRLIGCLVASEIFKPTSTRDRFKTADGCPPACPGESHVSCY